MAAAVGVSCLLHVIASWLVGARVTQVAGAAWGRTAALCWLLNRIAFAWLAGRLWRSSMPRKDAAVAWSVCVAMTLLVVLPWLLFSLWQLGTIQQDSGAMKALWAADLFPDVASRIGRG